jgi:hypothetical protein
MPPHQLVIPNATQLDVRLTGGAVPHSTSGYRDWKGRFESSEPIVALVVVLTGTHLSWTRTSHRGSESLETRILFAPTDEEGRSIRVCFSVMDATAYGSTCVDSIQTQPSPLLQTFTTGHLVHIATLAGEPQCELKALFLARRDVVSVRNGVWHARGNVVSSLDDPWRHVLVWGRTGELDTTGE